MSAAPDTKKEAQGRFARISTASFKGERRDATIRVPHDFKVAEGAQLAQNCFIGHQLGEGIQGAVYELMDAQGQPLNLVLKSVKRGAMAWMSNVLPSMEREWAIGHRLVRHCTTAEGLHPGFMRVGAALIIEEASKQERQVAPDKRRRGKFKGMVLEKLNGQTLDEKLGSKQSGIQDVHYLREALFQVLTALAEAQKLGFRHWDLRMKNIMEHRPAPPQPQPAAEQKLAADVKMEAPPTSTGETEYGGSGSYRKPANGHMPSGGAPTSGDVLPAPGSGHRQRGQPASAAAAAPVTEMVSLPPTDPASTAASQAVPQPPASEAVAADFEEISLTEAAGDEARVFKIIDYGHADFGDDTLKNDAVCVEGPHFDPHDSLPKWMLESGMPEIPVTEKAYRVFWWRKGDVYRMLMSLQNIIDGSTWPKQDAKKVQELVGLIHHVTGKRISAYFADYPEHAEHGCCGPRFWRRANGPCHFGRRWLVRVQTFASPYNPGITAAEALALPFFSRGA